VLNLDAAANVAAVRRFEQEARAASSLNHPGIVTIHDTGECDGRFYIVMELVEGTTLRHMLRRGRPPSKKALQSSSQLADALAKAHEVGNVHRDLKPENVLQRLQPDASRREPVLGHVAGIPLVCQLLGGGRGERSLTDTGRHSFPPCGGGGRSTAAR
jgi:serine/threonine protein kinase